ncbi:uncharacterized protein LOC119567769 isoform X2 [Chelonia mydas]|uniref:uncharacterized protein LOC119567769 isoform X2 n=1 Tax=Chelonia mydas TaxID=8469 RepID=UPI0018A1B882|nr:uncharacterized protein LOC119567769 isoform X2 [Chelonia mydas]
MPWVGVFLGLFLLGRPSGCLDGTSAREDCLIVHVAEPEGSSVNTSIPNATYVSETSFFVQKYNTSSSSWQDVIYSSNEGSQTVLSSFKETLSFSGGYFKMENVSKGADGVYRIQDEMYRKCVAVVNFTVSPAHSHLLCLGPLVLRRKLVMRPKGMSQRPGIVSWDGERTQSYPGLQIRSSPADRFAEGMVKPHC